MAESGLSVGFSDLKVEVSFYLGYGRDLTALGTDSESLVEDLVQSGVRNVYFPPAVQVPVSERKAETIVGHRWSWLRKDSTFSLTDGDAAQDFPDDFGEVIGKFHYSSGSAKKDIPIIESNDVYSLLAEDNTEGAPKYAAVHTKTYDGSTGQRFEVLWYPVPDTSYTVSYQYQVLTYALSDSAPYPLGGMSLSELYIASCLAVAEQRTSDNTKHSEHFKALLVDAIIRDREEIASQTSPYDAIDTNWSYTLLKQKVGQVLGFGAAASKWTEAQTNEIDSFVQSGVRRVYYPTDQANIGYKWSFMRPETTLSVSDGDDEYSLPASFGSIRGRFHFDSEELYPPVEEISVGDMRELLARPATSGPPQYFAIQWDSSDGTAAQAQTVKFWPEPDDDYTLHYQYEADASVLTSSAPYPLGGEEMREVYIEACLALVEQTKTGQPGIHTQMYMRMLNDAIARDRKRGGKIFGDMSGTQEIVEWRRGYNGYPSTVEYNGTPIE